MRQYINNFIKYRYLLHNLIERDMKVKYRRSILGMAWSVLNPLLMTLVLTAVFSNVFKFDIPNFPLYYLTGSVVFTFFSDATNTAMGAIVYNGYLIKKVYVPKYIFPLEKVLFAFINALFSLLTVFIVMLFSPIELNATLLLLPIPLVLVLVFSIGIGLLLSAASVFFRDIFHLYSVMLTALMYMTPIFYPINIIPENLKWLIEINPLYYYVDYIRQVALYGIIPDLNTHLICIAYAVGAMIIGALFFKKKQTQFILHV